MNAAQRAAKRFRREHRKVAEDAPPAPVVRAQFHRFYLPTREKADELAQGMAARGREVTIVQRSGALPWQAMLRANQKEMTDPGLYAGHYHEFAEMFGGQYGGML